MTLDTYGHLFESRLDEVADALDLARARAAKAHAAHMQEVADVVRVPVATLRYWRHLGTGPHSFRIGRAVRY